MTDSFDALLRAASAAADQFHKELEEAVEAALVSGTKGIYVIWHGPSWVIELSDLVPYGQIHEKRDM